MIFDKKTNNPDFNKLDLPNWSKQIVEIRIHSFRNSLLDSVGSGIFLSKLETSLFLTLWSEPRSPIVFLRACTVKSIYYRSVESSRLNNGEGKAKLISTLYCSHHMFSRILISFSRSFLCLYPIESVLDNNFRHFFAGFFELVQTLIIDILQNSRN